MSAGAEDAGRDSRDDEPRPAPPPDDEVAELLERLAARMPAELDTAELTVAGGDIVQIVCVAEVAAWLEGHAARARAGAPL